MAKKSKKEKQTAPQDLFAITVVVPPQIHPNEEQEDPINGKFVKSIEVTSWGTDWA